MAGVTKEQIARAKEWDLVSYLMRYEPQELMKCGGTGGGEYYTVSHDSLRISNGMWHWHSRGIGGRTALDYLIKVRGMGFVEAVETLCEKRGAVIEKEVQKPHGGDKEKPFVLPAANRYGAAMVSYLQGRGIDAEVINRCIGEGILYESRRFRNCVFVGRDMAGRARYAFLRGTGSGFKGDVEGSDKRYGFFVPAACRECPCVAVTESPIDALSVASCVKMRGKDWTGTYYLSLGGTSPRALIQFLNDRSAVTNINLCLDNDKAGIKGMGKIREEIQADERLSGQVKRIADCPPPLSGGKDYNEFLKQETAERRRGKGRAGCERNG